MDIKNLKVMKTKIIGRENEIERLKQYIDSDQSEFIAIYGRRRVGKTFLIKELFENQFVFRTTGKENANMQQQLLAFSNAMSDYFDGEYTFNNWSEAFRALSKAIERKAAGPKIIFIDELPWLETPKSGFISEFEFFWNNWAYYRNDIKLIVCGSATSWMLNNIINSRGGLHNRVTRQILMSPFSLKETEKYFKKQGFAYERQEIIDCYMALGGVAYYLSLFDKNKTVAENIDSLCFAKGGNLIDEFGKLYKSLFKKSDNHIAVIRALNSVGKGMTRPDLVKNTKIPNNGNLTTVLDELEQCEFIRSYSPFGKSKKDKIFQLTDMFSLFHLRFIDGKANFEKNHWAKTIGTSKYNSWCGYAFEMLCLHHIDQIVSGLGIDGMIYAPCSWAYRPTPATIDNPDIDDDLKTGAQIDLLIDRNDKTITVCEMKYSDGEYVIDKDYNQRIQDRLRTFKKVTKTRKTIVHAFITPQGLANNMYARKVGRQVTGEELFK